MPRRLATDRSPEPLFGDYASRILLALTAVLSTAVIIAHIPGSQTIPYTPWGENEWGGNRTGTVGAHDMLTLYPDVQVRTQEVTSSDGRVDTDQRDAREARTTSETSKITTEPEPERRSFRSVATLGPDANKPRIVGGMKQLYLNVEYPKEAQQQHIQGRVILNFVVHETGRVSDITVLRSLHPLCDSAVVRAVRNTTFVPAEENGKRVAVRMALPVRFQLLGLPGLEDVQTPTDEPTTRTASAEPQDLNVPR